MVTVRDELHQLIDHLPEEDIDDVLDYLRWLALEIDTLSDEEWADVRAGEEQLRRKEFVTLADLQQEIEG